MDVAARFGDNLVRCRKRAGVSQDELSVLASVHPTEISQLERGLRIPRVDTLAKLCASLEVELGDLMAGIVWSQEIFGSVALGRGPMAEGIRKRHSKGCASRQGRRCNCNAGWEAWVFSKRDGKKIRKTFRQQSEAKSWRGEAVAALSKGRLSSASSERRPLYEVMVEFVAGMKSGEVRPRGRQSYKPNTVRSYERAIRLRLRDSELGSLRPGEVRRGDVQAFADELLAIMSPGSASNILNPLQAYYRRAVHREELSANPTEGIDLPPKGSKRPRRIVSPQGAAALLAALPPEERPIWATAFYAGLREGSYRRSAAWTLISAPT